MTVETIRLFALSVLALSMSGVVYTGAALVYDSRMRERRASERDLYRRVVAVKLAGVALFVLELAHAH